MFYKKYFKSPRIELTGNLLCGSMQPHKPSLISEDIATEVARRLKKYRNLKLFERFAMFKETPKLV